MSDRLPSRSVTIDMATRYGMEAGPFEATLRATVLPKNTTREEFAAFLLVARAYNLNPVTREIYAFPKKGGGIQPIVSVDGWANIINTHPQFDGMDFVDRHDEKGNVVSITCRIYRKDRSHAVEATEYMAECKRGTEPWQQWPRRMLRHKAMVQCARYAFALAGIVDPDEYLRRLPAGVAATELEPEPELPDVPEAPAELPSRQEDDDEVATWMPRLKDLRMRLSMCATPPEVEETWTIWDAEHDDVPQDVTAKAKEWVDQRLASFKYEVAKEGRE